MARASKKHPDLSDPPRTTISECRATAGPMVRYTCPEEVREFVSASGRERMRRIKRSNANCAEQQLSERRRQSERERLRLATDRQKDRRPHQGAANIPLAVKPARTKLPAI